MAFNFDFFIKFFIILFAFGIYVTFVDSDDKNSIKITTIDCWYHKEYITNVSCKVKAISRSVGVINAEGVAIKPLDNIYASMEILRKSSITYRPFLVNVTANVCQLLAGSSQSFYAQFMLKWIAEKSDTNLIKKCPFMGSFYMRNLTPVPERMPMLVPPGDYRVDVNFYLGPREENFAIFKVKGTGTVTYKKGVV